MILEEIIKAKEKVVEQLKAVHTIASLEQMISQLEVPHYSLQEALTRKDKPIHIIGELKKASPSKGCISEAFPYLDLARAYEKGGAVAISVLTEETYFRGANHYLTQVKEVVNLPVLRKDFIIDPLQIYEAKAIGADAILLIVALLPLATLKVYMRLAKALSLECLVEVHNEAELLVALEAEAPIIGINNRDLKTFKVSLETTSQLRCMVPHEIVVVSESGVSSSCDIRKLKALQVEGVLIGESLMRAEDATCHLRKLIEA